jgi:hypothetical protein
MDDFKVQIVLFLTRSGFTLGTDFSMDANGDLLIGTPEAFAALYEFMEHIADREA